MALGWAHRPTRMHWWQACRLTPPPSLHLSMIRIQAPQAALQPPQAVPPAPQAVLQVGADELGLGPQADQDAQVAGLQAEAAGGGGREYVPHQLDGKPQAQAHDPVHVDVPQQQGQLLRVPAGRPGLCCMLLNDDA